jgi:hypothetical protein
MGLTFLFILIQGVYISRYTKDEEQTEEQEVAQDTSELNQVAVTSETLETPDKGQNKTEK